MFMRSLNYAMANDVLGSFVRMASERQQAMLAVQGHGEGRHHRDYIAVHELCS